MAQELLGVFTQMNTVAIIFLVLAMVLLILEIIIAGFGYFGIAGCACFVVSFIIRLCQGATLVQWITLIIMTAMVVICCTILTINSKQKGTFNKNPFIQEDTSIPKDYSDPLYVYGDLIDKEGELLTQCRPVGKALIDGETYEVLAVDNGFITKGAKVKVVDVAGESIFVERI